MPLSFSSLLPELFLGLCLSICIVFSFKRQFLTTGYIIPPKKNAKKDLPICGADCWVVFIFTFWLSIGIFAQQFWLSLIIGVVYNVLLIYLACAIISIQQFGIPLSIKTIQLAKEYSDILLAPGSSSLASIFKLLPIQMLLFVLIFSTNCYLILFSKTDWLLYSTITSILLSIFLITKMKITLKKWYNFLILMVLCIGLSALLRGSFSHIITHVYFFSIVLVAFMVLIIIYLLFRSSKSLPFFSQPSCLTMLLTSEPIKPIQGTQFTATDRKIIEPNKREQNPSKYHGLCKGANILLFSIESLSSDYITPPFFQELAKKSWVSDYHICLSPNTNTSFHTLFRGEYFNTLYQNAVKILKNNNFLTQYICPEPAIPLLHKLEFAQYYELDDLPEGHNLLTVDGVMVLAQQAAAKMTANKQYFVHMKNIQTHMPYYVYNETPEKDDLLRYKQAALEADLQVRQLVEHYSTLMDLQNTIIIYTADHGQSFGEMSYRGHSNSIIHQQTKVPFLISHPALAHRKISFSSHFDLWPTLFDLLGFDNMPQSHGVSLGHDNTPFSHILFSETRCGNIPSCFGHINKERKIMIDMSYNTGYIMDLNDKIINELVGSEKSHYQQVLFSALQKRGLVNRGFKF